MSPAPSTSVVLPEAGKPDTSKALALGGGLTLEEIKSIGQVFMQSGMFKDTKSAAQAITKVLAGQELGVPPMQAMRGIHVVDGNPQLSAGLVAALVKRSGRYDYRLVEANDSVCVLEWFQNGEQVGQSNFTREEASAAGLDKKANWRMYAEDMLFARALTRGARRFCPDVFGGAVYTLGEDPPDSELRPPAFLANTPTTKPPRFADPEAPRPEPAPTGEAPADVHGSPKPDGDNLFDPEAEAEAAAAPEPEWVDPA